MKIRFGCTWATWRRIILIGVPLFFFCTYFYLHGSEALHNLNTTKPGHIISNQPDEMSNYFFIRKLFENQPFGMYEVLSDLTDNQVHPRSMTVVNDVLAPIGFPFFISVVSTFVFLVTSAFGESAFTLAAIGLTPMLAVLTGYLLYGIIRRIWNDRMALLAFFLVYILPPWWYYASRPFQHTVMFVSALMLGMYGLVLLKEADKKIFGALLCACGISVSLAIRPTEAVWVIGMYGYGVYLVRKYITWQLAIVWLTVVLGMIAAFCAVQYSFYGNIFASGYVKPDSNGAAGQIFSGGQGVSLFRAFLFPFGFDFMNAIRTSYYYIFKLWYPWALFAGAGAVTAIARGEVQIRRFVGAAGTIGLYLILSYGSWNFSDNLMGAASIGSSQTRYFMPLYLALAVLVAYLIDRVLNLFYSKLRRGIVAVFILILFFVSSASAVYISEPEGLLYVHATLQTYHVRQQSIYSLTPAEAVIVTRYGDKYIFPGRKVIIRSEQDELWKDSVKALLEQGVRIFWYDLKLTIGETGSIARELDDRGVRMGEIIGSWENLELRELRLKTSG